MKKVITLTTFFLALQIYSLEASSEEIFKRTVRVGCAALVPASRAYCAFSALVLIQQCLGNQKISYGHAVKPIFAGLAFNAMKWASGHEFLKHNQDSQEIKTQNYEFWATTIGWFSTSYHAYSHCPSGIFKLIGGNILLQPALDTLDYVKNLNRA